MSGSIANVLMSGVQSVPSIWDATREAQEVSKNALAIQSVKASNAFGEALRQATDPDTGVVDYPKAAQLAANMGPLTGPAMAAGLKDASALRGAQYEQANAHYNLVSRASTSIVHDPSDDNVNRQMDFLVRSGIPKASVEPDRQALLSIRDPEARRTEAFNHALAGMDSKEQMDRQLGTYQLVQMPDGTYAVRVRPPMPGQPGGMSGTDVNQGVLPATLSPGSMLTQTFTYPATEKDIRENRAHELGEPVTMTGDEVLQHYPPNMLPRGLRAVQPQGRGGAPATVQGRGGKPASSTAPPALPPQPTPAPGSPASPPAPAPQVFPWPTPAGGGGPPAATAAPPAAPASPPAAPPPPRPGVPTTEATPAGGGVLGALAQLNPLRVGSAEAATYNPGGPGLNEQAMNEAAAAKLKGDMTALATFQNTQFPYVQALKAYGEGVKTGGGADFWNGVYSHINTTIGKINPFGEWGPWQNTTERNDKLRKWLANLSSANPLSAHSDAAMAQVLQGSASMHINETTGEDMVKAGLALQRMNAAATREYNDNAGARQAFPNYLKFLNAYHASVDPRAFMLDLLNPEQKLRLRDSLAKNPQDKARFKATLDLADRTATIGGAGMQGQP